MSEIDKRWDIPFSLSWTTGDRLDDTSEDHWVVCYTLDEARDKLDELIKDTESEILCWVISATLSGSEPDFGLKIPIWDELQETNTCD